MLRLLHDLLHGCIARRLDRTSCCIGTMASLNEVAAGALHRVRRALRIHLMVVHIHFQNLLHLKVVLRAAFVR